METLEGFFDSQRVRLTPEGFHIDSIPDQMLQRVEDWLKCDDEGSGFKGLRLWQRITITACLFYQPRSSSWPGRSSYEMIL
jgi:hypothetical protein